MSKEALTKLTLEELKKKEKQIRIIFQILIGFIFAYLVVIILSWILTKKWNIGFVIILCNIPLLLIQKQNLKDIRAEIELRG